MNAQVDAGRLLTLALDVSASPGNASGSGNAADYARLVDRYLADASFRLAFDGLLEGVGLSVATADPAVGVVVRAAEDSPWAWPRRSTDLPWNRAAFTSASERASRALVMVALLAYMAPSAADLDDLLSDPATVLTTVAVRDLEQFVRDFCEQREAESEDPSGEPDDRPLWWHWLQLPPDAPTAKRIARTTTTKVVYDVLSFLHEQGWLIDTTPAKGGADKRYRPRRRLLHHYRDLLLDPMFVALRRHAARREG